MPKRVQPLADIQIMTAAPRAKDYKLSDGGGLYILVTPSGGKLWRLKYRFKGIEKSISFGAYPDVSLDMARQRRDSARKHLADGVDPSEERKNAAADALNTFEVVAADWLKRFGVNWTDSHRNRIENRLKNDVYPFVGKHHIRDITPPMMLRLLRRLEVRSREQAHKAKSTCSQIFRYAVATGKADRDIVADLRGAIPPVKHTHMAAPTDPKSVKRLLIAIELFEGSLIVKSALRLAPLLFVRPGELRHAEWDEIDFETATWRIPAHKMKMRVEHIVPLSRSAMKIISELKPQSGHSRYLFPGRRSIHKCISENTINVALRTLGFDKTEITGHGFRAMARTMIAEQLQYAPDIIEAQLAHVVPDRLGRAYNRTAYLIERRQMMEQWAEYLDRLRGTRLNADQQLAESKARQSLRAAAYFEATGFEESGRIIRSEREAYEARLQQYIVDFLTKRNQTEEDWIADHIQMN